MILTWDWFKVVREESTCEDRSSPKVFLIMLFFKTRISMLMRRKDSDRSPADDHDPSATYDTPPESNTPSQPSATPSHLPLPTPPQSPSPTSHPSSHISVEDRVAQLQHTLTILHGERATLTTSLKTARRDAQKADAVLRSQIDTLRRASEKNTAAENRARQKVLALQEAVKRAQTATEEMEELVKEVENALPALQRERREKERVYNSVFVEAEKTRKEMEREQENVRKVERGEADLGALGNRLERINAKREKLEGEGGTIQDLEEELREVQREIERAEMDPYGFSAGGSMETGVIDTYPYAGPGVFPSYDGMDDTDLLNEEGDGWDPRFSYVPPRARIHSQPQAPPPGLVLGPIGRPPPAPIQRPSSSHVLVPTLPSNAAATSTSNSNLSFSSSTGKRSNRNSLDPPFVYQPSSQTSAAPPLPPSQPLLPSHTALKSPQQQRVLPTSSTSSSSLSPSLPVSGTGTMLSSKAPPFEPGRGMVQAARAAASTSPVQVSKGGTGGRRRSNSKRVKGGGGGSGDGHSGLK